MRIDQHTPPEILLTGVRVNAQGRMTGEDYMELRYCGHLLELSHDDARRGRVSAVDYWQAIDKLKGK